MSKGTARQRNEMDVEGLVKGTLLPVNDVGARGTPQALRLNRYVLYVRFVNLLCRVLG